MGRKQDGPGRIQLSGYLKALLSGHQDHGHGLSIDDLETTFNQQSTIRRSTIILLSYTKYVISGCQKNNDIETIRLNFAHQNETMKKTLSYLIVFLPKTK